MKLIANKYSELLHPQIDFKSFADLWQEEKEVEVTLGRFWTGDKTNLLTNKFCANFLACCLKQTKTVLATKLLVSLLLYLHRDYESPRLGLSLALQNIHKACKLDRLPKKATKIYKQTKKLFTVSHSKAAMFGSQKMETTNKTEIYQSPSFELLFCLHHLLVQKTK